jgi:hypothetical protein
MGETAMGRNGEAETITLTREELVELLSQTARLINQ